MDSLFFASLIHLKVPMEKYPIRTESIAVYLNLINGQIHVMGNKIVWKRVVGLTRTISLSNPNNDCTA